MKHTLVNCAVITRLAIPAIVAAALAATWSTAADLRQTSTASPCRVAGSLVRVAELSEGSGLAVSRRVPGRLWSHNDSGAPVLIALDENGSIAGRVRVTGASVEDWEAIAVGPCGSASCLHIADIGDNDAARKRVTIYRLPEPDGATDSAAVSDVFHATYPDGAHDAEALLITPDGRMHIVTKGETGPVALYRFPRELRSGGSVQLERIGEAGSEKAGKASRITDGSVSPDGQWTALRTRSSLMFYRTSELLAGQWREATRVDLAPLREPQGEGVALGADNAVFVAGEGGGKGQPGTFARFTCAPKG
jgi:hypothetical protein